MKRGAAAAEQALAKGKRIRSAEVRALLSPARSAGTQRLPLTGLGPWHHYNSQEVLKQVKALAAELKASSTVEKWVGGKAAPASELLPKGLYGSHD